MIIKFEAGKKYRFVGTYEDTMGVMCGTVVSGMFTGNVRECVGVKDLATPFGNGQLVTFTPIEAWLYDEVAFHEREFVHMEEVV